MRFLVDTNTFRHPAVSHWEHQDDQLLMWGRTIIGLRRFQWKFKCSSSPEIAKEVPYVPALGMEGHTKQSRFYTYQLLELESWTVKPPVDWAQRRIPDLYKLERLRPRYEYNGILMGHGVKLSDVIRRFVDGVADPRLAEFKKLLGPKHTQDAFHLFVCEDAGLDGFITLDLKLRRKFDSISKKLNTSVIVLTPSEACAILGIEPVEPAWFHEGDSNVWSNNIVQLFARPATWRDKIAYVSYRGVMRLSKKFGIDVKFKIPGY